MKGWFLFVVLIAIFQFSLPANMLGGTVSLFSDPALPKIVVEEVTMEASKEAPVYSYKLSYDVDTSKATFTLMSSNYAINTLGFKLISQKTGPISDSVHTINDKMIQVDLSKMPKGTYYLRLCQQSGDIIKIYRLIKA